jgi:serine protease Do
MEVRAMIYIHRNSWKRIYKNLAWNLAGGMVVFCLMFCVTLPEKTSAASPPASFAELAQKLGPAVVNISTVKRVKGIEGMGPFKQPFGKEDPFEEFFRKFFGDQMPREFKQRSLGSGFFIDKDGDMITNNHVVANADKIEVRLSDNKTFEAEVVGRDPKTDLALIRAKGKGPFPYLELGNSDNIKVGDWVVAVGNPFGLENTVTAGIISAKQRNIGAGPYDDFLQTDASINPGNSGGPLVNLEGEVIGINTAIVATGQGIGFAIPANLAKNIIAQLKNKGKVVRGWLGVMIQKITPELMKSFSLKEDKGALVADLTPNGPAEKAGMKRGDVIIEFNGKPVGEWAELPQMVAGTEVGKVVPVKIIREGNEKTFQVTIGELEEENTPSEGQEAPKEDRLGMSVEELTPEIADRMDLKGERGVVISSVDSGGPAAEAGLRPGDLIKEIQREPVNNMDAYRRLVRNLGKTGSVLFLIKRGGNTFYITVELG